jgi:Tfp pilus assembly protein PilF
MARATTQLQPQGGNRIKQALALHQRGQLDEAERIYSAILAEEPARSDVLRLLGLLRHQQGRNVEALGLIGAVLQAVPRSVEVLNDYGLMLGALGRDDEALARFDEAIALRSDHINALNNRANLLARLKHYEEALAAYERLLAKKPDHLGALNECGGLNMRLGRVEAALDCYVRALAIAPLAELHVNKGSALRAMNRDQEALASFAAAAAMKPDCAEAHWNASLIQLRGGDFAGGWRGYEWRWRKADWADRRRSFPVPLWLGKEPINGKTILLHAEQGFGDTIQFVRYVPLVARHGAHVILECPAELVPLIRGVDGLTQIVRHGAALPPYDLYCPLLSLPLAFETEMVTIPANVPYLRTDTARIVQWHGRLPENGRLRVGICWAGASAHLNDRQRSIPLERFAKLLSVPSIDFVSLQKEVSANDAAILHQQGVIQFGQEFGDFADTAAVIAMLDLVITVDTSVAHLAGAMGKAVGLLLSFSPDWRWMLDRTDSPWYPTMRLFRQTVPGDWTGPIERARGELTDLARPEIALH